MEISLEEFNSMKDDITEIKDALLGNKFTSSKGALWVIEDHHRRISELERYRDEEVIRIRYQQDKDKRTQNLIKTLLAVITIASIFWAWYKNK